LTGRKYLISPKFGRFSLYFVLKTSDYGSHRIERDQTLRLSTKKLGAARQDVRASSAPSHRGGPRPAKLDRRFSGFAAIPAPHHPADAAGGTYGSYLRYTVTADSKNSGVVAQQGRMVEFVQLFNTRASRGATSCNAMEPPAGPHRASHAGFALCLPKGWCPARGEAKKRQPADV
jgi:hypothetical protein